MGEDAVCKEIWMFIETVTFSQLRYGLLLCKNWQTNLLKAEKYLWAVRSSAIKVLS